MTENNAFSRPGLSAENGRILDSFDAVTASEDEMAAELVARGWMTPELAETCEQAIHDSRGEGKRASGKGAKK